MRGRVEALTDDPRRTMVIVSTVTAAVVTVAAVLALVAQTKGSDADSGTDALKGAEIAVEKLLSYDFRSVDSIAADNADLTTGKFGEQYPSYVSETLAPPVRERRLQATTNIIDGAVVSGDGEEFVVLLFVDQTYGVVGQADQEASGSRVRVTMREVDGDWRVAELETV